MRPTCRVEDRVTSHSTIHESGIGRVDGDAVVTRPAYQRLRVGDGYGVPNPFQDNHVFTPRQINKSIAQGVTKNDPLYVPIARDGLHASHGNDTISDTMIEQYRVASIPQIYYNI